MPSPGANLLLALATFISGGVFAVSGRLWLFGFVALIAGAIFQSALIRYLVVLYVVGMFVVTPIVDNSTNPRRETLRSIRSTRGTTGVGDLEIDHLGPINSRKAKPRNLYSPNLVE